MSVMLTMPASDQHVWHYRDDRACQLYGIKPEPCAPGAGSPIGEAIPDLRVYVLDSKLRPVPYGVIGDVCRRCRTCAGVLGSSDLTADRFVADPYGPPGTRMYRTGDLAKRLADGTLDYLGRSDHQVKIRGFRIELGEIESVLTRHADVAQAAVIVREDQPGDRRLAAYVVSKPGGDLSSVAELRRYAASMLPDYMVPGAFVLMDILPLTPNGSSIAKQPGSRYRARCRWTPSTNPAGRSVMRAICGDIGSQTGGYR